MIEFHDVTKRFGTTVAVGNFSGQFEPHRTSVLLGSSGSGKTTILRMINRMVDATSGRITIDEEDISQRDRVALRRSIGYVMQHGGLLPHRRVIDNVATVPLLNGVPKAEAHDRAVELLDLVGLDRSLARRYPSQLSGGQQQRVGVARALAPDPNILLMDEPFAAVDPLVRRDLQEELLRIQADLGKTIVFVTHDVEEAFLLGDSITVLREAGEVAQRGTSEEILGNPADDFVAEFVGLRRGDRSLSHGHDGVVLDRLGRAVGRLTA